MVTIKELKSLGATVETYATTNDWGFNGVVGIKYSLPSGLNCVRGRWQGRHSGFRYERWDYKGEIIHNKPSSSDNVLIRTVVKYPSSDYHSVELLFCRPKDEGKTLKKIEKSIQKEGKIIEEQLILKKLFQK